MSTESKSIVFIIYQQGGLVAGSWEVWAATVWHSCEGVGGGSFLLFDRVKTSKQKRG